MSCFIRIRCCPSPNNFFDDIIPKEGLQFEDWLLKIISIPCRIKECDGKVTTEEIRWIYAEINCNPEDIQSTIKKRKSEFNQYLGALIGFRNSSLPGNVKFTMWFDDFVENGVQGNISPYFIDVGVNILNVKVIDGDGCVVFDAEADSVERSRAEAVAKAEAAKEELKKNSKYIQFLSDKFYCRAWESYNLALSNHDHAISHLYDVRDAAAKRINNARNVLITCKGDWSKFGAILNCQAVNGGRHNGSNPEPIRPLTQEERTFLFDFSKKLLYAFGDFLEFERIAKREKS